MQHHKEYLALIIILKRQSDFITILHRPEPTSLNHLKNSTLLHDQAQTDLKLEK